MRKPILWTQLLMPLAFLHASCSSNSTKTPAITTPANCTSDGQKSCLTTETFPAGDKAAITAKAADFRTTLTIGGVTGTLASCGSDNGSNCVTSTEYPSIVKADLTASQIKSGIVVAGITGTYAPECTSDGQSGCLSVDAFKAGDVTTVSAFDLRNGKTLGGQSAKLTYAKNGTDTTAWNRTSGAGAVASSATPDSYDTLDDYNNGGSIPTGKPSAWSSLSSHLLRDSASDTDADGTCNNTEDCVVFDKNTRRYWAKSAGTTIAWEAAITACEGLSYGSYTDWRLPDQKELLQLYIDGIYASATAMGLSQNLYQSATTNSSDTTSAYRVNLATGEVTSGLKSGSVRYICVR